MAINRGAGGSGDAVADTSNTSIVAVNAANAANASKIAAAASADSASASATIATTQAGIASTSATNAAASLSTVAASATNAANSATTATTQATNAAASATTASTQATNAATSASSASTSAATATTQATNASSSASSATTSATSASSSASTATTQAGIATTKASEASTSASNAATSASTATTQASSASTSATNAATSASNAATSATSASSDADTATAQAVIATGQATAANTSATNANASAASATTSASTATTQASNAASSATSASGSASTATTQAGIATTQANTATTQAGIATTQASNASSSATSASGSASTATTQASNASTSASNASTSASNAATSESNAATSASNASTSATASQTAKTAAEAAQTATESVYDSFDDRYLGAKATAPTTDNDGGTLLIGALYFDTVATIMKIWTGSTWLSAFASLSGALIAANNLSDLITPSTARTNLGLGSLATQDSDDVNITGGNITNVDLIDTISLDVSGDVQIDGNLTVGGTVTTVNTATLAVDDNLIYLNDGSLVANPDLGIAGNYNDGTYKHAGFFRDATDGKWKFFHNYTPEPDASPYIDITHASFALSDIQANRLWGNVTGNVTGNADTATNVAYTGLTGTVPTWNQNTTGTAAGLSSVLAVSSGGTGTATPSLVAGSNITISGTFPNQTITGSAAGVTSVSATSPIASTGGFTPTISIPQATTSVSGYLTATDWNTFNGKYSTGGALGTPSSGTLTNCTGYTYANLSGTVPTWNQNTTGSSASCTGNAATATTATTLSGDQTNWASNRLYAVANMLGWKNYANNHVIIDASASTSPTGSAINNTNSANAWTATYPTLMGWNGSTTYGVRVDSARIADSVSVTKSHAGNGYTYLAGGALIQWGYTSGGNYTTRYFPIAFPNACTTVQTTGNLQYYECLLVTSFTTSTFLTYNRNATSGYFLAIGY